MAWDSTRPVPWGRLVREWLLYVAIMTLVLLLVVDADSRIGALAGLLVSGPLYLAFGAVLAKFGYQRQRLRRPMAGQSTRSAPTPASGRPRPAPTRRTGGGTPRRR
jgi:hypothetical protein